MKSIVAKARALMKNRTLINKAPAWALTEIAIEKGRQLSKLYKVNEDLVLAALYLAHIAFSTKFKGKIQQRHEEFSAKLAEKYLKQWKVSQSEIRIILNAIRAHHGKVPTESKVAEVVKNAECFKFLTVKGELILLHDMATRYMPFLEAVAFAKYKAKQKMGYITLKEVKPEAERNYKQILKIFNF
jgi:hypothetical protein